MRRWLILAAVLFGIFLVFASVRVVFEGWHEYNTGIHFQDQNKPANAVTHLIRAARWYFPVVGADNRAIHRLIDIADKAFHEGNHKAALAIYREVRASILGSRSLYTPHKDILELCETRIATIMSKGDEQAKQRYLAQLRTHIQPNPWLSLAAVLTFFAWLFFSGYGFFYSVTRDGEIKWKTFGWVIAGSLGLLAVLMLFLRLA